MSLSVCNHSRERRDLAAKRKREGSCKTYQCSCSQKRITGGPRNASQAVHVLSSGCGGAAASYVALYASAPAHLPVQTLRQAPLCKQSCRQHDQHAIMHQCDTPFRQLGALEYNRVQIRVASVFRVGLPLPCGCTARGCETRCEVAV